MENNNNYKNTNSWNVEKLILSQFNIIILKQI